MVCTYNITEHLNFKQEYNLFDILQTRHTHQKPPLSKEFHFIRLSNLSIYLPLKNCNDDPRDVPLKHTWHPGMALLNHYDRVSETFF